ncbi:hypothetical protein GCM10022296_25030 [Secundilactobacillus similis DSM 23365 = JCM 2765]
MDDDRLKQGTNLLEKDYFNELLERVRSIRASERRVWQKITDIFAEIKNRSRCCIRTHDGFSSLNF